jgi:hypothetical protein
VFNAQELVAVLPGLRRADLVVLPAADRLDAMRLENTGEPASNLLVLLLGRQDQVELLRHSPTLDDEDGFRGHRLDLLPSREDLPLEDWIDTDDPELLSGVAAVFDRIEDQLRDKQLPPPPDRVADPE